MRSYRHSDCTHLVSDNRCILSSVAFCPCDVSQEGRHLFSCMQNQTPSGWWSCSQTVWNTQRDREEFYFWCIKCSDSQRESEVCQTWQEYVINSQSRKTKARKITTVIWSSPFWGDKITSNPRCRGLLASRILRRLSHKARRNVLLASGWEEFRQSFSSFLIRSVFPTHPQIHLFSPQTGSFLKITLYNLSPPLPSSSERSTVSLRLARNLPITLAITSAVSRKSWHLPMLERARKSSIRRTPML